MLPRRHIRIKVFQSLYTYYQKFKHQSFDVKKEFTKNIEAYLHLYNLIIHLLFLIRETAEEEININKLKLLPNLSDLNPNKKFIQNSILKKINSKKEYTNIDNHKIQSIAKNIFKKIKKTKTYLEYMQQGKKDKKIEANLILRILKNHIIVNEKIHDFIEEHSIYWNDDLLIVYNTLLEKINNKQNLNIIQLFRHKEDEVYAYRLLEKTIENIDNTNQVITQLAKNWDKDRIALSDLIIMKMAITEMKCFAKIPNKVTLDEYIDISKEYSSPKSKEFINGILDKYVKDILEKKL